MVRSRPRHASRRVVTVFLSIVISLEVSLQIFALGAWWLHESEPTESASGGVLCVGDSFTFGIGATDQGSSYPSQLQSILREDYGWDGSVTNCGWPGQTSADVLTKLEAQLEIYSPKVVCVLVGANDGWSRPALVADDRREEARGFRWEWRTARFAKLLFQPSGSWATEDANAGGEALPVAEDPVPAAAPDRAAVDSAITRLLGDAGFSLTPDLRPEIPVPTPLRGVLRATQGAVNNIERRELLVAGLSENEDAPRLLEELVRVDVRLSRREDALRWTQRLAELYESTPSLETAASYIRAALVSGSTDEQRRGGLDVTQRFPNLPDGWRALGDAMFYDDLPRAAVAYVKLVELSPERAGCNELRRLASLTMHFGGEPEVALRVIVAAALAGGHARKAGTAITKLKQMGVGRELVQQQIEAYGDDPLIRTALQQVEEYLFQGQDDYLQVLRQHLDRIAQTVRENGGRTVLLSYPENTKLAAFHGDTAADIDAEFADVFGRFRQVMPGRDRSELFVKDGHCNDAGYRIVAEIAAGEVAELLGLQRR